jgi:glycosyltransferase involved in cell wall biosynthesis
VKIVYVAPFGLQPKHTVSGRALPLAQALARRGHRLQVIIPPWDYPPDAGRSFSAGGVEVTQLALPSWPPPAWHALLAVHMVRSVLAARADVVHCFKPKGFSGAVAWTLWQLKRLGWWRGRLLVDTDDWEGRGGWNERGGYNPLARGIFAWQEPWGLAHCDAVTAASAALADQARGYGAHRIIDLPNGLTELPDLPRRADARARLKLGDGPVALVYTRFVEIDPERLGGLLVALLARAPGLQVAVVGEGLRREHERLLPVAQLAECEDRLRLFGWSKRRDLPVYWAAADFALYPSDDTPLTRAKSPLRLVELMGAGRPIVAHGVGEVNRYLEHEVSGLIAPSGDDAAFVAAAVRLSEDAGLRTRLGNRARAIVADRYTWDRLAERVEAAYAEIEGKQT